MADQEAVEEGGCGEFGGVEGREAGGGATVGAWEGKKAEEGRQPAGTSCRPGLGRIRPD